MLVEQMVALLDNLKVAMKGGEKVVWLVAWKVGE